MPRGRPKTIPETSYERELDEARQKAVRDLRTLREDVLGIAELVSSVLKFNDLRIDSGNHSYLSANFNDPAMWAQLVKSITSAVSDERRGCRVELDERKAVIRELAIQVNRWKKLYNMAASHRDELLAEQANRAKETPVSRQKT